MLPSVGAAGVTAAALPKGLLTLPNTEADAPPTPPPPATGCVVARLNGVTTAVVVVMLPRPLPNIGAAETDAAVAADVGAANRLLVATAAVPAVDVAAGQPKPPIVGVAVVAGTATDVAGCTAAAGLAPKLNGVVLNVDVVVLLPPPRLAMLILGVLTLLPKLNIVGSDFGVLMLLLAAATAAPKKFGLLVLMALLSLPSEAVVVFAVPAATWVPKKKLLLLLLVLVVVNELVVNAVVVRDVWLPKPNEGVEAAVATGWPKTSAGAVVDVAGFAAVVAVAKLLLPKLNTGAVGCEVLPPLLLLLVLLLPKLPKLNNLLPAAGAAFADVVAVVIVVTVDVAAVVPAEARLLLLLPNIKVGNGFVAPAVVVDAAAAVDVAAGAVKRPKPLLLVVVIVFALLMFDKAVVAGSETANLKLADVLGVVVNAALLPNLKPVA